MDLPNGWNPNCLQRSPDRPVYRGIAVDVSKLPPLFSDSWLGVDLRLVSIAEGSDSQPIRQDR